MLVMISSPAVVSWTRAQRKEEGREKEEGDREAEGFHREEMEKMDP